MKDCCLEEDHNHHEEEQYITLAKNKLIELLSCNRKISNEEAIRLASYINHSVLADIGAELSDATNNHIHATDLLVDLVTDLANHTSKI